MTDEKMIGWIDQAVKHDQFKVRTEQAGRMSSDDERHSVSVIDMFRSFNQSIEKILQLDWNDELQHAMFLTALARTVGLGVARYCEIVEQKFTREMDRLSPEQEAAANQSRQEKWVQLAKDAWSNREKIEPFQFFSEVRMMLRPLGTRRLIFLVVTCEAEQHRVGNTAAGQAGTYHER